LKISFINRSDKIAGNWLFKQAACVFRFRQLSIHLREKNIVYPTERSVNANAFTKLAGQDIRFSMKMMFAPDPGTSQQPV